MRLGKVAAVGVVLVLVLVVGPVSSTHAGPISPSGATPALFANPQTRSVSGDTRSSSLNGSNSSGPYSIDFSEFGLANNVTWNVTLMGITFPTRSSVPIGAEPTGTLYDPENHNMYIALDSGFVNVYNGSTNAQIGSIPVGLSARWMALDTANGDVYVTNTGSNNVSVIDGRTDKVIDNVNVESNPIGIAYDATNGNIYVANSQFWSGSGGNTISVINTTQNTVVQTISVGNTPRTIAYDPTDQLLFVPNYYSNNLSLISTSTDRVVGSISFNSTVIGPMYDSVNHLLYVAEDQLNLLEEVNVSTDSIVGSIPVGPVPQHPVYDPLDGFIFVPDEGALSIAVIDPTSEEVIGWLPSEASAGAAGVDLANGVLYITGWESGEPLLLENLSGLVFLPPESQTNTTYAGAGAIEFSESPGCYHYEVTSVGGYAANPTNGFVNITNSPLTVSVSFGAQQYDVRFVESGLGTNFVHWSVSLAGVTLTATTGLANGNVIDFGGYPSAAYPYAIPPVVGYALTSPAASGTVVVSGASVRVNVVFVPTAFDVKFTQTGIPDTVMWELTFNGSTSWVRGGGIDLGYYPNGTYLYAVGAVRGIMLISPPANGTVVVAGAAVQVNLTFLVTGFDVSFTQRGLPSTTVWSVDLAGTVINTTGSSMDFGYFPNGTYLYSVSIPTGYSLTSGPANATVTVAGMPLVVNLTFELLPQPIIFHEYFLPYGPLTRYGWTVVLGGVEQHSTGTTIEYIAPKGNYSYLIIGPPGWEVLGVWPSGSLEVSTGGWLVNFLFVAGATPTLTFAEVGLPKGETWCASVTNWTHCADTTTIKFSDLTPGSYWSNVAPKAGYVLVARNLRSTQYIPLPSLVSVSGRSLTVQVEFCYTIAFTESGLPSPNGDWSVTVKGTTWWAVGSTINLTEPNGTYSYRIASVPGYTHTSSPAKVLVSGSNATVTVVFAPRAKHPHGSSPSAGGSASFLVPTTAPRAVSRRPTASFPAGPIAVGPPSRPRSA